MGPKSGPTGVLLERRSLDIDTYRRKRTSRATGTRRASASRGERPGWVCPWGPSERADPADLWPPGRCKNQCLWLKSPSLWYFLTSLANPLPPQAGLPAVGAGGGACGHLRGAGPRPAPPSAPRSGGLRMGGPLFHSPWVIDVHVHGTLATCPWDAPVGTWIAP